MIKIQVVEPAGELFMSIYTTNYITFKGQHKVNLSTIVTTHKQTDEKPNKSQSKGRGEMSNAIRKAAQD